MLEPPRKFKNSNGDSGHHCNRHSMSPGGGVRTVASDLGGAWPGSLPGRRGPGRARSGAGRQTFLPSRRCSQACYARLLGETISASENYLACPKSRFPSLQQRTAEVASLHKTPVSRAIPALAWAAWVFVEGVRCIPSDVASDVCGSSHATNLAAPNGKAWRTLLLTSGMRWSWHFRILFCLDLLYNQ